MKKSLSLAAIGALACILAAPTGAMAAAPGASSTDANATQTLIERIGGDRDDDRGRRGRDRDDDRDRGDWRDRDDRGGWRGGGRRYRCRFVRHQCADRFGWGGWRFRSCMLRRGCF